MGARAVVMLRGLGYGTVLHVALCCGLAVASVALPWYVLTVVAWGCFEIGMSVSRWQFSCRVQRQLRAIVNETLAELERTRSEHDGDR